MHLAVLRQRRHVGDGIADGAQYAAVSGGQRLGELGSEVARGQVLPGAYFVESRRAASQLRPPTLRQIDHGGRACLQDACELFLPELIGSAPFGEIRILIIGSV